MKKKFSGLALLLMFCSVFIFPAAGFAATAPKITTTKLPDAYLGESYYEKIKTTGTKPITFTLGNSAYYDTNTDGALILQANGFPDLGKMFVGMDTSGIIKGTPGVWFGKPIKSSRVPPYTFHFSITAKNSAGSDKKEFSITFRKKPSISYSADMRSFIDVGELYTFKLTANDGAPTFTWNISKGSLPPGLSLKKISNKTAQITGKAIKPGTYTFTVKATDKNKYSATQEFKVKVFPNIVISGTLPNGKVGVQYSATLTASGGTSPYTWSISKGSLPPGLSLKKTSSTQAKVSGTPTKAGTYSFTIKVTDAKKNTATQVFTVTIKPNIVISGTLPDGKVGVQYSATLTASGGTSPYTWSISKGSLPPGLSLKKTSSTQAKVSGTPTKVGTYSFTIKVTDAKKNTVTEKFTVTITPNIIIKGTLPNGKVGVQYSATLTASGGTSPYTWSISKGSLPPGLAMNKSTGTISGTPSKAGTYSFTIKVTDAKNYSNTKSFSITITAKTKIVVGGVLPSGKVGSYYSGEPTVSGGTAPYTWSHIDGSMPPGVSLNKNTGKITGTPTEEGAYEFTLQATDAKNESGKMVFIVYISPKTAAKISITSVLLNGMVNSSYSATLLAAGGTAPYTWSIISGSLPPGLTLNKTGSITGKPTKEGVYEFVLQAADKNGNIGTQKISLRILGALGSSLPEEFSEQDISLTPAPKHAISLEVISSDVLSKGSGRDSGLVEVRAGRAVTFIVGELPEDASDIQILVNDEAFGQAILSENGMFSLPAEIVYGGFSVRVVAHTENYVLETEELNITAEE